MDPQTRGDTHGRIEPSFNPVSRQKPLSTTRSRFSCQLPYFLLSSHVGCIKPVLHEQSATESFLSFILLVVLLCVISRLSGFLEFDEVRLSLHQLFVLS
jgi:hypothetical protein